MSAEGFKFNLPGYRVTEELYRSQTTIVYRGEQVDLELDSVTRNVIIKILAAPYPTYAELLNFRHEYGILKNLDLPGIVSGYRLEEYEHGYALVMEDFGGISLGEYYRHHSLNLADLLNIAIQIAEILHALGQQRIIHKDIKPANLTIDPVTKLVKLIDFSIASVLPQETPGILSPNLLEGTLAYLAPEQTGRMNRSIDYRSDFYALGVTLYELLTGKLPFETLDPLALIYCHLAQIPIPPHQIDRNIPEIISQIVIKLMSKNAEDRYQSALGLKYDLERCQNQLQTIEKIAKFELGQRDLSDRFVISERLYGRETETQILLDAFRRVAEGNSELVLIAGSSGIGKTAIINEVHKPNTRQYGYFIKGKFDLFNRNSPLSAFINIFQDLIEQLLSESDAELASWKRKILAVVGDNARILIEVIPALERIIGSQPPAVELGGTAAQNRFNWLFQQFVGIFTQPEHPLTICLDDLQWADSASLELIKLVMENHGYLLVLGAYRDNEVSAIHPAMLMVEDLKRSQKIVSTIRLSPLNLNDINKLICDTLHCSIEKGQYLTELIYQKTQGNPFFITQFLKALHTDGEIWFNHNGGYWECDLVRVQALSITDDGVEFMAERLQKLPLATQEVLKLAACIGDRFDLNTLTIVAEQSRSITATALWQSLAAGLILPTSQIYKFWQSANSQQIEFESNINLSYRFLHDRVQQAAYTLIPAEQRQSIYLKIGRLLLENVSLAARAEQIFAIVDRLNLGRSLMTELAERERLCQLNFQAAQKAQLANAYAAAAAYLEICIELLPPDRWQSQTEFTQRIYESAIEVAYLGTNYDRLEQLITIFLAHTDSLIDRIRVHEIQMLATKAQGQLPAAIQIGLQLLQSLGIEFPAQPTPGEIAPALAHSLLTWQGQTIASLVDLPTMTDPIDLATMRILTQMIPSAYQSTPLLMPLLIFKQIELSIAKGNCDVSPFIYADYGLVLCGIVGDLEAGCQFGQLALDLLDRFQLTTAKCRTYFIVHSYISHWQASLSSRLPLLREGYQLGLATGDLESSALNAQMYCAYAYFSGQELSSLADEMAAYRQGILQIKQETALNYQAIYHQTVLNLLGQSEDPCQLIGSIYSEVEMIPMLQQHSYRTALYYLYYHKAVLAYLFGQERLAADYAVLVASYADSMVGMFAIALFCFYHALIDLQLYPSMSELERVQCLEKIAEDRSKLRQWADAAPMNHLHKLHLVEAELQRVLGNKAEAIELYDLAISQAKINGYIQEKALANELTAKFYLAWGKEKVAAVYMQEAYYCYAKWGAKAKTEDLERRYPQLLVPILQPVHYSGLNSLSTLTTIANSVTKNQTKSQAKNTLDLVSVIQSAQVLSKTIDLEELIQQLTQIILENSGAETCILALPDLHGEWHIRSMVTVKSTVPIARQLSQLLTEGIDYPANLIYWIKNTFATIICDARQPLVIPDRYLQLHQPQSVFALPIVKQEQVLGVVYLEHRHVPDIFTENTKIVISFLCTQAAIALENANLYRKSQAATANAKIQQGYLSALLDNIPHLAWLKDRDGRFIAVNQSFGKVIDCDPIECVGKTDFDFLPPDLAQQCQDDDLQIVASGNRKITEEKILNAQGHECWLETIKTPIKNHDGEITGTVGIALDITDRKQIQADLAASKQQYYDLIQSIDGVVWEYDLTTDRFTFVSDRAAALLGYPISDWIDRPHFWRDRVHPEDLAATVAICDRAIADRCNCELEYRLIAADGRVVWVYDNFTLVDDADGRTIATKGLLLDITDRQQSKARYQKLSDNIPGAIYQFRLAPDGSVSYPYISSGCWELFHLSPCEIMADAKRLFEMMPLDEIPEFQQSVAESAQNLTPWRWEGRAVLNSNEVKWIKCASRPELQPDGAIVWDGVMFDITERQQAQLDLRLTNERLEVTICELQRATRLKDEFLATMSHELRTPLNAILGMSEALQEEIFGDLNPRQIQSIQTIERSGRHLLALINDILDLSKISAGKLELNIATIDLAYLCNSSLAFIKQQALQKQIQLDAHLPPVPGNIAVDERRIRQVLINLLSNAVKFTPQGGQIALWVTRQENFNDDSSWLEFAVRDTGIGIAAADLDRLFQPFVQLDSSLSRHFEGTGLGLALVKQIVELHGGTISIESELDRGSCFSVRIPNCLIPLASSQIAAYDLTCEYLHQIDRQPLEPALILLAEDNQGNINTLTSYLSAKGYRTIVAENGREAIELVQTQRPDLILMDIQMPEMDGLAAISWIRQHPHLAQIPIVALTALAMEGDREQCLAAGANEYLTKPVKLKQLAATIQQLMRDRSACG